MINISESKIIIFESEVGSSTQRLIFETVWYKHKDMILGEFDLCHSFRIVKLRRNKLKIYATFLRLYKGFSRNRNQI